jgi:soluble lytic murein transglycosylase-like protein
MVLKWGLILCGALAMLALAWLPVAFVANGKGRAARERVASIVDTAVARAAVMPSFQSSGAGFLDPRPVPVRLVEPVEQAERVEAAAAAAPVGREQAAQPGRDVTSSRESPVSPERPYARLVQQAADRHGVDPRLVHALIEVESGYRADAVSVVGAMGLMQLMPGTARRYGVSNPLDPASNIDAGTRHLRSLLDEFGPVYALDALAAYNAGEGVVRRHGGIPPYPQTHRFVRRVLEVMLSQTGWGGGY